MSDYDDLSARIRALCAGETDEVALMATVACELHHSDDRFDWTGDSLKSALSTFADIVRHADPAAGGLTWDEAAKKCAEGQCAFLSMNDSVYGEFIADGATEADFGHVAYPGTDGAYLAISRGR